MASESAESESLPDEWKYFPFDLGESEELEDYEIGGFHPVHFGDLYDGRYRVVHKLGFGGFSTVWLARDVSVERWVALKIIVARDSPTYEARSVIANHAGVAEVGSFATVDGSFWLDGPNGRHLCLVLPVLGPALSNLSDGIYSRLNRAVGRDAAYQASQALAYLHSQGLCHGDFTATNMALRLTDAFKSLSEADLLKLLGPPQTAPLRTYSEKPPGPHGPEYIVAPLNFCSSPVNLLTNKLCIMDFDQSFLATKPPPARDLGTPAKYLAPEVAVGHPPTPASDVWALGCAIFRLRSGFDLFFDYDTSSPLMALQEIAKTLGAAGMPEAWKQTRFDGEGRAVLHGEGNGEGGGKGEEREGETGGEGEEEEEEGTGGGVFADYLLEESEPSSLVGRVRAIRDEPAALVIDRRGEPMQLAEEPAPSMFEQEAAMRVPYPAALASVVWKPTAVCVEGEYITGYGGDDDETESPEGAFPRIPEAEAALLVDLLSRVFTYDPKTRITAEEVSKHPWFSLP